ncbi:MAG: hypothetical protein Q4F97_11575 [Bacteroidales bacterium]|nr:hypothetical protein [Bacteroidales bacterium]
MERFIIDNSMSSKKRFFYLTLGVVHILIGLAAILSAFTLHLNNFLTGIFIIYTILGIVFIFGVVNKFHTFIIIDDNIIIVKNHKEKTTINIYWDKVQSVAVYPSIIKLIIENKSQSINLANLSFHDMRDVKNKIIELSREKKIPFEKIKNIRRVIKAVQ